MRADDAGHFKEKLKTCNVLFSTVTENEYFFLMG